MKKPWTGRDSGAGARLEAADKMLKRADGTDLL